MRFFGRQYVGKSWKDYFWEGKFWKANVFKESKKGWEWVYSTPAGYISPKRFYRSARGAKEAMERRVKRDRWYGFIERKKGVRAA